MFDSPFFLCALPGPSPMRNTSQWSYLAGGPGPLGSWLCALEASFVGLRPAPISGMFLLGGSTNDKGQRSRWLVRRVASLTSELR
jgi:hypothetical protein